jgi:hypothetical protein
MARGIIECGDYLCEAPYTDTWSDEDILLLRNFTFNKFRDHLKVEYSFIAISNSELHL